MGSIIKKIINGNIYHYYVECKRINGKPKIVNQKYLGSEAKLIKQIQDSEKPLQERVLFSEQHEFGMVALLYDLAVRLDLVGIIDSFSPKRHQGASIGWYILIEAINRVVAPSSTSNLEDWYKKTYLPCLTNIKASAFNAQNFWNNTNMISEESLEAIEDAILSKVLKLYNIDISNLIYDATNFFSFIDTKQESVLAKRGHCKSKRNDLRIVGLSLMVSPDFSIPLIHETYPGNLNDAKEFARMVTRLKNRCKAVTDNNPCITLVFDRGNNSEDNINLLRSGGNPFHYVGGLKKGQAPALWSVPKEKYTPLLGNNLTGQSSYRMEVEVFGQLVTGLIVHNPELEDGQIQGIKTNIEKTNRKLFELHERLMNRAVGKTVKGKKPTIESVRTAVEKILKTEYMKDIFHFEIMEKDNNVYLNYSASECALNKMRQDILGKTALFTDRNDFSNEEIVSAYRSAWYVERAFRQMKDTNHLTVRPLYHWTDKMIKIHIFTCVLAYQMCCLLVKELSEQGYHTNINKMIENMSEIKRIETIFGDFATPEKVVSYTRGGEFAQQVLSLYNLSDPDN